MSESDYIRLSSEPPTKKPPPQGFIDIFVDPDTGRLVQENPDGTRIGLGTGTAVWGQISGNLEDQVELRRVLALKASILHNHDGVYAPNSIIEDREGPTGFLNRYTSGLAFDNLTRRFDVVVAFPSAGFVYWANSKRRIKEEAQSVTIPDIVGQHYIYFHLDTLISTTVPFDGAASVATIYWNGYQGYVFDERHGVQMDARTIEWIRKTRGPAFASGFIPTCTNATMILDPGEWFNADVKVQVGTQTTCRVFYRTGAVWDWTEEQMAWHITVNSIPRWDDGGVFGLVTSGRYFCNWLFLADTEIGTSAMVILSQDEHTSITAARASDPKDLDLSGLPTEGMLLCYKIIGKRVGHTVQFQEVKSYLP